MDLISSLRYAAQKKKEEEEAARAAETAKGAEEAGRTAPEPTDPPTPADNASTEPE